MKTAMNRKLKIVLLTILALSVSVSALFLTDLVEPQNPMFDNRPPPPMSGTIPGDFELYYKLDTVIASVNAAFLIVLLITYVRIYAKTGSEFTVGLSALSSVLLLYTLTSNPLIQGFFGFHPYGLGPFAILPELFTLSASVLLLYLTFK